MGDNTDYVLNIKRTPNGERNKKSYKKVLLTENKANGVGLDIIKRGLYND